MLVKQINQSVRLGEGVTEFETPIENEVRNLWSPLVCFPPLENILDLKFIMTKLPTLQTKYNNFISKLPTLKTKYYNFISGELF